MEIYVTGDYLCFFLGLPTAVLVPKSAFENTEQARAFAEQAVSYWRSATGRQSLLLNPAGVWPPAPSGAPCQEPDGRA